MSKYPHLTFGWKAVRLYESLTLPQINDLRLAVQDDPASANPAHAAGKSIDLYTKAAQRKLDALGWAVTYHLQDRKRSVA